MKISNYLRTPISIKQLVLLSQNEMNMYCLYRKRDDEGDINKYTSLFLDEFVSVIDNDEEFYPSFARDNNLIYYLNGDIAFDIIWNTRHQIENPAIKDYLINFNYYNKYDAFFTFRQ